MSKITILIPLGKQSAGRSYRGSSAYFESKNIPYKTIIKPSKEDIRYLIEASSIKSNGIRAILNKNCPAHVIDYIEDLPLSTAVDFLEKHFRYLKSFLAYDLNNKGLYMLRYNKDDLYIFEIVNYDLKKKRELTRGYYQAKMFELNGASRRLTDGGDYED